ncbi:MAG: hypothetical protein HY513_03310 [Candidatus Aenigmarchaeota archaeon]|nr:hypothetical protein [Candidatus Aenigmarchaeota archaeon]
MDHLELCIEAAIAGGKAVENYKSGEAMQKADEYVGHHAIVTDADFMSQSAALKALQPDKESFFITEEHVGEELKKRMLTGENIGKIKSSKVYIIDELDGSSSFSAGHYEWSVSIGFLENMVHKAGAVFAPKIENGTLFFASQGEGAFRKANGKEAKLQVADRKLQDCYVLYGPDVALKNYPVHSKMFTHLGNQIRTTNLVNSCALGMSLVAAGNADAIIQPLHSPWDWAAGKLFVEEAGGSVLFYEMDKEGKVFPISRLEPRHYDPSKRAVGFVAANEALAEEIMEMLLSLSEPVS